jgi:O-methyltransferase involved in polyketide biosynthesis
VPEFDPKTPSIARIYDYFIGGRDNFAADRKLAKRLIDAFPSLLPTVVENKEFLNRAVTWAANEGVGQFIDLGCGLPTSPNTHETARAVQPDARVAYVDNDPIVVSHLNALVVHGIKGVIAVDSDVRDVAGVLARVAEGIDLDAPVCLIMGALLHFFDVPSARDLVAEYAEALAPGSCVVLTMGLAHGERAEAFFRLYMADGPATLYQHSAADFASFFGDLEIVPPGVCDARTWRPGGDAVPVPPERESVMIVGIARVG